ncbi:MAG: hypothetical protein ABIR87_00525 [Sphingomicrobium sp.]
MTKQLSVIVALLATAACQQQAAPPNNQVNDSNIVVSDMPESGSPTPPVDHPPAAPPSPSAPVQPVTPIPAPAPVPQTPDIEKSAVAAKTVIDAYFAALATKHYGQAYRMWGGNGQASGLSETAFAASFGKYKIYDGTAYKPGTTEGAAGSIYIEFPVTVTGLLAKGGGFHLSGPMTLKRVNDVDGSTAEQRRWHIASSDLKPRP